MRDIVRSLCMIVTMAAGSSLLVETRFQLAAIDTAHRGAVQPGAAVLVSQPAPPPPGRLRSLGRAILDLADAGLGVVR